MSRAAWLEQFSLLTYPRKSGALFELDCAEHDENDQARCNLNYLLFSRPYLANLFLFFFCAIVASLAFLPGEISLYLVIKHISGQGQKKTPPDFKAPSRYRYAHLRALTATYYLHYTINSFAWCGYCLAPKARRRGRQKKKDNLK